MQHQRPSLNGRCRNIRIATVAAAAVDTKKQSRLAFVDLQPPDPILGMCLEPLSDSLAMPQGVLFTLHLKLLS